MSVQLSTTCSSYVNVYSQIGKNNLELSNSSSICSFTHYMYMQLNGAVAHEKDCASDTLTEGSSTAIIPCLSIQLFPCCHCAQCNASRCLVTILSPSAQQLWIPPSREIFLTKSKIILTNPGPNLFSLVITNSSFLYSVSQNYNFWHTTVYSELMSRSQAECRISVL